MQSNESYHPQMPELHEQSSDEQYQHQLHDVPEPFSFGAPIPFLMNLPLPTSFDITYSLSPAPISMEQMIWEEMYYGGETPTAENNAANQYMYPTATTDFEDSTVDTNTTLHGLAPLPPPDSPPPRHRYYDPPGSSHHAPAGGVRYRSPAREDRRSSFPNNNSKERSCQSRSRSPRLSIPPPRPVPTSMAQVSPEARLFYTHRCIAYLCQTTLKDAADIPLMTLMTFMNDGFESQDFRKNYFTFEEVRDCVAELGRLQMFILTQEGNVQVGESAMD